MSRIHFTASERARAFRRQRKKKNLANYFSCDERGVSKPEQARAIEREERRGKDQVE
jgi:hypothetical protein